MKDQAVQGMLAIELEGRYKQAQPAIDRFIGDLILIQSQQATMRERERKRHFDSFDLAAPLALSTYR